MKILVTGGAGFIGSAVIRLAIARGHNVVNVDALTYAACLENVAPVAGDPGYAFEHVDIRDRAALDRIFAEHRPDVVMHLAAESHVDRSIDGPASFMETNILGQETINRRVVGDVKVGSGSSRSRRVGKLLIKGHGSRAPHFIEALEPQVVREGDACVFSAVVEGTPPPRVDWYWDLAAARVHAPHNPEGKSLIQESNKISKRYDALTGVCALMIRELTSQDLTNVVCVATNEAGKATSTANLVVVREYRWRTRCIVMFLCFSQASIDGAA